MLWSLSIAIEPIQRYALSGSYVLAWKTVGVVVELPAFLNSYQRIAPCLGLLFRAGNRDITDERFLHGTAAKIAISQAVHQPEIEVIKVISRGRRCRLRDAIAMIARVGVADTRRRYPRSAG